MSNPFYYLAGLLLAGAYPLGVEPLAFARIWAAPWVLLGALFAYGLTAEAILIRAARPPLARFGLRLAGLAVYAALLFVFHWPLWVWERLGLESDPIASTLLTLAPLFLLYAVLAVVARRHDPHGGGLGFAFRGFLALSLLPILVMLLFEEFFERVEALRRLMILYPAMGWLTALLGLAALMMVMPALLRLILGARPLEPGPLKERLERQCLAMGFDRPQLLVVRTGRSRLANAFVVGFSARWRYVFFTEAILQGMTPEQLECVLAHEVTHTQKRHILYYLLAMLAFSLFSGLAHEGLDAWGVSSPLVLGCVLGAAGLFLSGFGYVSRRFETEADLVAARVAPPVEGGLAPYRAARRMAEALGRVADLNGVPPHAPSWRHFTIEKRIEILLAAESEPAVGKGIEGECRRIRSGGLGLMAAAFLCASALLGVEHGKAPEKRELLAALDAADRGQKALDEKRYAEALPDFVSAIEGGFDVGAVWVFRAECERALGRENDARVSEDVARKKGVSDPRLRLRLTP